MTVTEKIVARHAGRPSVTAGELVVVDVDTVCIDDVQFSIFRERLRELGDRIAHPERVLAIADHYLPPSGLGEAEIVSDLRAFGREHGIRTLTTAGIKHQVFVDERIACPGRILVATDSHTNTSGAVGALAFALGPTDVAAIVATGKTWMRVPATIRIEIGGELAPGVFAADVAYALLARMGRGAADYRTIEWGGRAIERMDLAGRMTLCNLTTEFGAKTGIVPPDGVTSVWAEPLGEAAWLPSGDRDAAYERVLSYDGADFEPVVAVPPSPANVEPVSALRGTRVDQAYLGSCTHGTLEDLHRAADVLRGRHAKEGVQLLVVPATQGIYARALADGTLQTLVEAGAVISSPGCGSCPGMGHEGTLAAGEVRISTQNRNFTGRSGHPDSKIYLASPAVVAAAAIAGEIVHPGEVLA
jgi:homoaconitate hydratase family protein